MRIHVKLKEIMLQVNLDEVTSKFVRDFPFAFNEIAFFCSYVKNWKKHCQCP